MKKIELTDEECQVLFCMNSIAFLNKDLLIPDFKKPYKDLHDKIMKIQAEIAIENMKKFKL